MFKKDNFGKTKEKFKFDHSLVFFCLHLLFPDRHFIQFLLWQYFFAMGSCLFLLEHFYSLSHCKTCWIMSMDDVGLKTCRLGTSSSMVPTSTSWCKPKVVPGRVQQPITNFTRPWDDFMVHDVNNPLPMCIKIVVPIKFDIWVCESERTFEYLSYYVGNYNSISCWY